MVSEWQTLPLEDCMAAIIDYRGKTPEKTTFGVPLVTAKVIKGGRIERPEEFIAEADFDAWMRRGMPNPGDIVMTTEAPLGEVAQLDGRKVALAQRVITLRGKPGLLDNTFLKFLLQSSPVQEELRSRGTGTTVVGIRQSELRKVSLTLPPLAEQKAIAAVLGALDDKIELNRRMNATLEAMARALFQSWFVDFDPVRANMDRRGQKKSEMGRVKSEIGPASDISNFNFQSSLFLPPATAALFPEHLEDSPLGHIPEGWEVARLDEIATVMMGLSPDGDSYNADGVGTPLINGPVEFGEYFPVKTKWTQAATRFAAADDLIFCVRGSTTGRRVISDGEYGIGRGVCAIRAKGGFHSFLYQTINVGLDRLLEKTTGSVFPSLSAPDIKGFTVLKPSRAVLEAYERTTKPLVERIQQNQHQSRTLATLRDTLLPKLLSGELATSSLSGTI